MSIAERATPGAASPPPVAAPATAAPVAAPAAAGPGIAEPGTAEPAPGADRSRWGWLRGGSALAALTWAVGLPVALAAPEVIGANPFSVRGAAMPMAAGAAGGAVLIGLLWRRASSAVVGVLAGAYAVWVAFVCTCALVGTPYGFGGLTGDSLRISAMATRYSTLWRTAEPVIPGLAGEYPPLFPWLIGRVAAVTGIPAWQLVAPAEAISLSAAVVVGYVLWRRFLPAPAALATVALGLAVFSDPRKGYEIIALLAFVPLVLATFATTPHKRLHWLPAGVLGGVMVLTYWGYLVFGGLGLLAVAVSTWRTAPDRRAFVLHVLRVLGVAAIVSSWYTVPLAVDLFTKQAVPVSDLYDSMSIASTPIPLPFLDVSVLGLVELVGFGGLFGLRGRAWWTRPLLLMLGGCYLYVLIGLLRFVGTGHTQLVHYVARLIGVLLVTSAVLTVIELVPLVARQPLQVRTRQAGVAALAVLLCWTALRGQASWMPPTVRTGDKPAKVADAGKTFANAAHVEPLPGGSLPRFAEPAASQQWFPVAPIQAEVEARLGKDARPMTLSADDRLFSFLPWYGYISADRTSSSTFGRFDDRHAELVKLSQTSSPTEFARRAAETAFGSIDVFVLRREGGAWIWRDIEFLPAQFGLAGFDTVELPNGYVLAIRKG